MGRKRASKPTSVVPPPAPAPAPKPAFAKPGPWLFLLVAFGVAARLWFVVFTDGTYDVGLFAYHAQGIAEHGLVGQYHASTELNHPPVVSWIITGLWRLSNVSGIPFKILLRAPIAAIDLASAFLLGLLFADSPYRWLVVGLYAVHPVAILFSSYHGNTDPVVAFFVLLSILLAARGRSLAAGAVLGASLAIKLPGLLAAPAIGLSFASGRDRLRFGLAAAGAFVVAYAPMLLVDPKILYERVFTYGGLIIHTTGGVRVWGFQNFFLPAPLQPGAPEPLLDAAIRWWYEHNTIVVLLLVLAIAWLRRARRDPIGLGTTVAAGYAAVYGFSNFWSFQYLAWSTPLWFAAGPWFLAGATALAGGYIWALYAFLCGNVLLRGPWDFIGHPTWPAYLLRLRDSSVLFFAGAALVFLGLAVQETIGGMMRTAEAVRTPRGRRP